MNNDVALVNVDALVECILAFVHASYLHGKSNKPETNNLLAKIVIEKKILSNGRPLSALFNNAIMVYVKESFDMYLDTCLTRSDNEDFSHIDKLIETLENEFLYKYKAGKHLKGAHKKRISLNAYKRKNPTEFTFRPLTTKNKLL